MNAVATIVITTRNRKDDLRRAARSAFSQDIPVEVIITDDASEDGTSDMVREEFPAAVLLRSEQSLGLIAQRNRAASAASCPIVFSIDDDAEFGSAGTVRETVAEFSDAWIGAVAIPHIDTLTSRVVNHPAPDDGRIWCVASFVGTSHAVRRDVFLSLSGYDEKIVHQGEEGDYCIRMLASGHVTRLGRAPMIQHHESPRRSYERMDYYGRRNDVRFAWKHAPALWLVPHLLMTTLNGFRVAKSCGRWSPHLKGLLAGWREILVGSCARQAVDTSIYRAFRYLKKQGPKPIEDILSVLPRNVEVRTESKPG